MLIYALLLVAVSYIIFVFLSDQFNPFIAAKAPLKLRRWRLGRALAFASLVAGFMALTLLSTNLIGELVALFVYLMLGAICIIPAVVRHRKSAIWQ